MWRSAAQPGRWHGSVPALPEHQHSSFNSKPISRFSRSLQLSETLQLASRRLGFQEGNARRCPPRRAQCVAFWESEQPCR